MKRLGTKTRGTLTGALAIAVIIFVFTGWKRRIGKLAPFWMDPLWHQMDLPLHAGRTPADWMARLLEAPRLVAAVERWYDSACFVPPFASLSFLVWGPPDGRRTRLLLTCGPTWTRSARQPSEVSGVSGGS
jgi:hypothetical protein